jgi:hypothetical protein
MHGPDSGRVPIWHAVKAIRERCNDVGRWLSRKQGDPFGKKATLKTDASVILSQNARGCIAKLREKAMLVFVVAER